MGKINIPNVYNWIPIFTEMAAVGDLSLPINKVDDFQFVRACDRRASSKHAVSTNRKSSTLFIGSDKSQIAAISVKMGIQLKTLGMLIFPIKILTASASSEKVRES